MTHGAIFVDWVSLGQFHPQGGLPILLDGVKATFDLNGNCRHEFGLSARVEGSHDSSVRVLSNGFRVTLSGNAGRFGRADNLFNHGWSETLASTERILAGLSLPPFTDGEGERRDYSVQAGSDQREDTSRGAVVSRIDLTCNYRTGSDAQARAVIRWLSGQSVARMKRGFAGDESVWFSNSRHMLKAYRKGAEMKKHGGDPRSIEWCMDNGIVRVEVELKKRLLSDLGLSHIENINDQRLAQVFTEQTEVFRRVDMSDEPDLIDSIPTRYRMTALAWLSGADVRSSMPNGTFYRHAKALRCFGLDIIEPRNIVTFPIRVRIVDLEPVCVPDWYDLEAA